jgi:hypothetical protein
MPKKRNQAQETCYGPLAQRNGHCRTLRCFVWTHCNNFRGLFITWVLGTARPASTIFASIGQLTSTESHAFQSRASTYNAFEHYRKESRHPPHTRARIMTKRYQQYCKAWRYAGPRATERAVAFVRKTDSRDGLKHGKS